MYQLRQPLSRRTLLRVASVLSTSALIPGCATTTARTDVQYPKVTIYSPAPDGTPLHKLNLQFAELASSHSALRGLDFEPVPLPHSINLIADLELADRAPRWPIVTTLDFGMARAGSGPREHGYERVNTDLKFVSRLCDTGIGIGMWGRPVTDPGMLRGKRIGVPPPGSAVRLMTQILLRDGWGIADEVTLVTMMPHQVIASRKAGLIDGTSWSIVGPTPAGYRSTVPQIAQDPLHYVPIDDKALGRVNSANKYSPLKLTSLLKDAPPLLSFAQALAVWDQSDPVQIRAILELIEARGSSIPGFAHTASQMTDWPALHADAIHPVALSFYQERGKFFTS